MRSRRTRVRFPPPPRVLRGDREHRWRCAVRHVEVVDRSRPLDRVADSDSCRARLRPKFEILGPVVVSNPVDVMDGFTGNEVSPQHLLSYENVLEDIATPTSTRVSWHVDHHVTRLVSRPTTLPVAVGYARFASTRCAGIRLGLFRIPAWTQVLRPTRRTPKMSTGRLEISAAFLADS
jgi:hypothetical protein